MDNWHAQLKELIKKNGLTASGLAVKAGLDSSVVRKIFDGDIQYPKINTLHKLSQALGIYPSELLPPEWQKPDQTLNLNILEKSIKEVLEDKPSAKLAPNQQAQLVIAEYLKNLNK